MLVFSPLPIGLSEHPANPITEFTEVFKINAEYFILWQAAVMGRVIYPGGLGYDGIYILLAV